MEKANGTPCTYHTIGGDGPYSYSKNSVYQKQIMDFAKEMTNKLIVKHLDIEKPSFNPHGSFQIADFGCSVGPNTFSAVTNIIEAVENKYKCNIRDPHIPEFLIILNDLVHNDFNALFRNLPAKRQYSIAAVPGSFHGPLLPKATLHIAHCSTSLHWLSKIPKEVTDKTSPAWNKGRIHYIGAAEEVKHAYSTQFKEDMQAFLSARGQELVPGGLMVLVVNGFPDGVLPSKSIIGINCSILGSCLKDMTKTGQVTEEKMDLFNLPFYYPTPSELKTLIEANGSFQIERLEKLDTPKYQNHGKSILQSATFHLRAIIGGLMEEHFGLDIVEHLFQLYTQKIAENPLIFDDKYRKEANYFLFLKRKSLE